MNEVESLVEPLSVGIKKIIEDRDRSTVLVSQKENEIADNVIRNMKNVLLNLEAVNHLTGSEVVCIATGLEKRMRQIYKDSNISKVSVRAKIKRFLESLR